MALSSLWAFRSRLPQLTCNSMAGGITAMLLPDRVLLLKISLSGRLPVQEPELT